jgi:lipoprotein NlpI
MWSIAQNHELAIDDFSEAIKLKPSYLKAYGNRAISYYLSSKNREALEDLKQVQNLGGKIKPAFLQLIKNKISGAK